MPLSVTVTGNLPRDPEISYTSSGLPRATFTVASTERCRTESGKWEDGDTTWVRCIAWRDLAEHIGESLVKGDRAIVTGTLRERAYEKDGQKRSIWELTVSEAGPSLKFVTTKSQKAERASAPSDGDWPPPADDDPPY